MPGDTSVTEEALDSRDRRFLVVDDIGLGRSLLQAILGPYGQVETADSADSAMSIYRDTLAAGHVFDLALLDIMMPGVDGLELFDRLRAYEESQGVPSVPVVMTTALDQKSYVYAAAQRGAVGYLVKPLRPDQVRACLRQLGLLTETPSPRDTGAKRG